MRLAVISDIHGNFPALSAVLRDIERQKADQVVCLGDIASKGPMPSECCEALREHGIKSVFGNTDLVLLIAAGVAKKAACPAYPRLSPHAMPYLLWHVDRMSEDDISYLASLPFSYEVSADGVSIHLSHASPNSCDVDILPSLAPDEVIRTLEPCSSDWVAVGHVHRPFSLQVGRYTLVNPGAVGSSQDGDWRASYAIIETSVPPGDKGAVDLRRLTYPIDDVVRVARERKYCYNPDWYERALRTGFWEPVSWKDRVKIDSVVN